MFYRPVEYAGRHFAQTTEYSTITWGQLSSIVSAFEERITQWYIVPGDILMAGPDGWHRSFSLAAIDCMLIDTLSQFEKGSARSSRGKFIDYVERKVRVFQTQIVPPIRCPAPDPDIATFGQALYFGFRCSILHEAHIAPYCQILPEPNIARQQASGITTYSDGTTPCSSVILDPQKLFEAMKLVFADYIRDLLDPAGTFNILRTNFKKKFKASFGKNIDSAV